MYIVNRQRSDGRWLAKMHQIRFRLKLEMRNLS